MSGRRVWKVAADPKAGLFGEPQKVADFPRDVANVNDYDVAGDGRLIVLQGAETDSPLTELSVISNWPGRLRELVRAGERE